MAKYVEEIDVFVGACSDVEEDVQAVKDAILEYNNLNKSVRYVPRYWKDSAYSSMGDSHAQYEINRQLLEQAGVFIFVVHSRIGTVVDNNETGIEKEFKFAIDKKKSKGCFVQLYEKNTPYPFDVDVDQLSRLKGFVERVSKNAGLRMPYKDKGELQERVRYSLSNFSEKLDSQLEGQNVKSCEIEKDVDLGDEEPGFLDYLEQIEVKFEYATRYILNYTQFQIDLSKKVSSFSKSIKYASFGAMSATERKNRVDVASSYFEEFNQRVEPEFPEFRSNLLEGMIAAIGVIHEARENGGTRSEFGGFLDAVSSTRNSMAYCLEELSRMTDSFRKIPRLTSRMKKASRRMDKFFSDYETTLTRAVLLADEALETGRTL